MREFTIYNSSSNSFYSWTSVIDQNEFLKRFFLFSILPPKKEGPRTVGEQTNYLQPICVHILEEGHAQPAASAVTATQPQQSGANIDTRLIERRFMFANHNGR